MTLSGRCGNMGIGDKLLDTIKNAANSVIKSLIDNFRKPIINHFKKEIAEESINPDELITQEMKDKLEKLKKEWKGSPVLIGDLFRDVFGLDPLPLPKKQMNDLLDKPTSKGDTYLDRIFNSMDTLSDFSLICARMQVVGGAIPLTHLDQLGMASWQHLDHTGVTQLIGYGYGQILNTTLGPLLQIEMNEKYQFLPLDADTCVRAKWRGFDDISEYYRRMRKLGYNLKNADLYHRTRLHYPGPNDWIRFAVREVFKPDIVEKYGYDTDFPTDIVSHALKAGVEEETMKQYWRAHWELPSTQMGYEMLHRDIIDEEELRTLLRIADMAPYWIDKAIAISWSPYTRVDARRMYDLGVLDDTEYLKALREIGYDPIHADKLLEWTKIYVQDPERQLTRSQIENLYKHGLQSRDETIDHLDILGYSSTVASLILELIDAKEEMDDLKEYIEVQTNLYVRGQIALGLFKSRLINKGVDPDKATYYVMKAENKRDKVIRSPSKDDLDRWVHLKLLSLTEYLRELSDLGYSEYHRNLYLKEMKKLV